MRKKAWITFLIFLILFLNDSTLASNWIVKNYKGKTGNIKININGNHVKPNFEPFILIDEGVTVVSLRDLSEILGFDVSWDEKSNTISITGETLKEQNFWASKAKKKIEDFKVIRNVGPFYEKRVNKYCIAGRFFDSGIAVDINPTEKKEFVIDLNKKHLTLEGYYGIEDETMNSQGQYILTILGDDRELFISELIKPSDYPRYLDPGKIDLTYINRLTVRFEYVETDIGDYGNLVAVLANFNIYEK